MITISSNSLDELNTIYKKLKKDFEPTDSIKLNQESMEYELILVKPSLDLATRSILEKVLDMIDLMEESKLFEKLTWMKFTEEMELDSKISSLKPLRMAWPDLSSDKRKASFMYLCKELNIEVIESEEKIKAI